MKKGFASITIVYSFLIVFILSLLVLLAFYTQKARLVDSIVIDAKEEILNYSNVAEGDPGTPIAGWSLTAYSLCSAYELEIPFSGYFKIELWGASGGFGNWLYVPLGGYTSGIVYMKKGEKLYFYGGGKGQYSTEYGGSAGCNGGGYFYDGTPASTYPVGGGGGATDVRFFGDYTPSTEDLNSDSVIGLNSRIMVAGGAGGGSHYGSNTGIGGVGGNLEAGDGIGTSNPNFPFKGGNQTGLTSRGYVIFGKGGSNYGGGTNTQYTSSSGGGGGGGYYGGQAATSYSFGGGGGSSFISGYAGVNAISELNSDTNLINDGEQREHTYNIKHYSGKYFIDGQMIAGASYYGPASNSNYGLYGNSVAMISYVGASVQRTNTNLNNVKYIKDCINGNSTTAQNYWVEIQAITDGENIVLGLTPTGITNNLSAPLSRITDGVIDTNLYAQNNGVVEGEQCVILDLSTINPNINTYDLDEIAVWHYYGDGRTYDNRIYVSSDNSSWTTIMSADIAETSTGKRISAYE